MGFRNKEDERPEGFPTLDEIARMSTEYLSQERTRLRTELAFRISDRGGPDHKTEITLLRELINAISIRLNTEEI